MRISDWSSDVCSPDLEQVEIEARYSGYLERQREEIARAQRHGGMAIPDGFDYAAVRGLSAEVRQKFERVRPQTVGQAQRIPGVTPAAISLLLVHLARAHRAVAEPRPTCRGGPWPMRRREH